MKKAIFNIKDFIYLSVLAVSITASYYSLASMTNENTIRIDSINSDVDYQKAKIDKVYIEVIEVKGMVMEIKGYLKQN